ncbi:MAG: CopG protein, partial [uncultured Gemmatimonadetes bacterium]
EIRHRSAPAGPGRRAPRSFRRCGLWLARRRIRAAPRRRGRRCPAAGCAGRRAHGERRRREDGGVQDAHLRMLPRVGGPRQSRRVQRAGGGHRQRRPGEAGARRSRPPGFVPYRPRGRLRDRGPRPRCGRRAPPARKAAGRRRPRGSWNAARLTGNGGARRRARSLRRDRVQQGRARVGVPGPL